MDFFILFFFGFFIQSCDWNSLIGIFDCDFKILLDFLWGILFYFNLMNWIFNPIVELEANLIEF
jgi:hypothetical protein